MADRFSGPRILFDPASDVADVFAFPSPDRPGCLVLVLDVFPAAAPTALFSDAITYRFRVRPVTPAAERAGFAVGDTEYGLDFTFATPGQIHTRRGRRAEDLRRTTTRPVLHRPRRRSRTPRVRAGHGGVLRGRRAPFGPVPAWTVAPCWA
ncbi:DUF4331 family protein, partial [Streptomyces neyagawaensis]